MKEAANVDVSKIEATDGVVWRLARALYEEIEHLNPSSEGLEWDNFSDSDRYFYRWCVEALFERELENVEKLVARYREELLTATTARYTGVAK